MPLVRKVTVSDLAFSSFWTGQRRCNISGVTNERPSQLWVPGKMQIQAYMQELLPMNKQQVWKIILGGAKVTLGIWPNWSEGQGGLMGGTRTSCRTSSRLAGSRPSSHCEVIYWGHGIAAESRSAPRPRPRPPLPWQCFATGHHFFISGWGS